MQQVNLYSEILKQQQQQSGINLYTGIAGGLVLVLAVFSAYLLWDISTIETGLQDVRQTLSREQTRINELVAHRPSQEPNLLILAEIEQWQNSVNEASQTLQLLAGTETQLSQGFSGYLHALANQASHDVWLTSIHIDGQAGEMKIEGSSFKPEKIPQALQQLQQEPAFKGHTFAKLIMQQSAKIAGQMDFSLSSAAQPATAKDHAQ